VIDLDGLRVVVDASLHNTGSLSDLADLADLGAVHMLVLEMLTERVERLQGMGCDLTDIRVALSDDVVLSRIALASE
jgi:hypothetical protein